MAGVGVLMILAGVDLTGVMVARVGEKNFFLGTPMGARVEVPERPVRSLVGKKLVALTFDDGPSSATTTKLLNILYRENVPATFFMLGVRVRAEPAVAQKILARGHEVGSHTMWHQNLARLRANAVAVDIETANAVFSEVLGMVPKIMRPPYGSVNNIVAGKVGAPMIGWTVDTLDWKYRNTESIMGYVREQVRDGAIILMHDIHASSVEAVAEVIAWLRAEGYEFVTVSELARIKGVSLENGQYYWGF